MANSARNTRQSAPATKPDIESGKTDMTILAEMLKEIQYSREQQSMRDKAMLDIIEKMRGEKATPIVVSSHQGSNTASDDMKAQLKNMTIISFSMKMPDTIS